MVGFSAQMEVDEAGTLERLKACRRDHIDPAIAACKGRIIKTTGDGLLIEFPSVVDAVRCAVDFQAVMAARNADAPPELAMKFRIGVNLGDVMVDAGDIFGDGVNVAARLEQIAEPGEVYVSAAVREQVGDKLGARFDDLGERRLKNISRAVRVFRVGAAAGRAGPANAAAVAGPSVAAIGEKPSIAVLPFANMSAAEDDEFFADGLTEDILTELSRFKELFVISRTSVFAYKGRSANISDVARELGVQYVLEGSVRRSGRRVRVTAQLIEAAGDRHIWAERYDRQIEDIFELQDQISTAIVATLPGRIEAATQERAARQRPESMAAYELVMTGRLLHHRSTPADNAGALERLTRAIELEPGFAHAHAWRACVLGQAWSHGWCEDRERTWAEANEELRTARGLDDNDSDVHRILAAVMIVNNDHDRALFHQERALQLNPNDDLIVVQQGEILTWLGRAEEGIEWIRRAMLLNPYHPERFWSHLGRACFVARRYREAIEAFGHIGDPDHTHHAFLACACVMDGDQGSADRHLRAAARLEPGVSIAALAPTLHYLRDEDEKHHLEALRKAGFPES